MLPLLAVLPLDLGIMVPSSFQRRGFFWENVKTGQTNITKGNKTETVFII